MKMSVKRYSNRFVQKKNNVIEPVPARRENYTARPAGGYPSVHRVHLEIAELYAREAPDGKLYCDELIDFIQHVFTEEEASVCRFVKPGAYTNTAAAIAASAHRPVEEVTTILDRLAHEKRVIMSFGKGDKKVYIRMPIVPGMFEMALMRTSMDSLTPWHRRFAELFMKLYECGFLHHSGRRRSSGETGKTKTKARQPVFRYLPVNQTINTSQVALPSDKLEEIFAPFETFAVGLCQCRMTEEIVGRGCGRPMEVCVTMGNIAKAGILSGRTRQVELKEVLEIKAEAEAAGLVTMAMNAHPDFGSNTSCSCCGCCCHALRMVSEFSLPSRLSPPHFIPNLDSSRCSYCGKCALSCPMGAITVDVKNKSFQRNPDRCIGCGQCAVACNKEKALVMEPVPDYEPPLMIPFGRMF